MSHHSPQTLTERVSTPDASHRAPLDPSAPRWPVALRDAGLLVARTLLGVILIAHGWQKIATNGLEATGGAFASMGVPLPEVAAALAAGIELGGGLLLVLGLFTPIAGIAIAGVLAGAFWFVHKDQGIFATDGGWELVAGLGLAAVVFALVLVASFAAKHRREALRLCPVLPGSGGPWLVAASVFLGPIANPLLRRASRRGVVALQVPRRQCGIPVVRRAWLHRVHAAGLQVHVWVVNQEDTMRQLLKLGVDGIMTDELQVLARVLGQHGAWPQTGRVPPTA